MDVRSQSPIRHVVVMGLMGSGKTTVGRALATRLGWPFDDSDDALATTIGATAREISASHGTTRLHQLEAAHLRAGLRSPDRSVITAAASVVDNPRSVAALEEPDVLVVLLRASVATLVRAVRARDPSTPVGLDPETMFREQTATRSPVLERLADLVVDVVLADSPSGSASRGRSPSSPGAACAGPTTGPGWGCRERVAAAGSAFR